MEQHPDDPIQHGNTPSKKGGGIYHEKQKRMLCAIHAIHNLLQINPFLTTSTCVNANKTCPSSTVSAVTMEELDQIADDLAVQEMKLWMFGDHEEEEFHGKEFRLSMYEKFMSRHRTPFLGNYSFEVLEYALERRGVKLSWWSKDEQSSGNEIGFIVNVIQKKSKLFGFLRSDRHWYSIAKIDKMVASNEEGIASTEKQESYEESEKAYVWVVIDSKTEQTLEISSRSKLMEYIECIIKNGGSVLRAVKD